MNKIPLDYSASLSRISLEKVCKPLFKSFVRALCYSGFLNNVFIKSDKTILDF